VRATTSSRIDESAERERTSRGIFRRALRNATSTIAHAYGNWRRHRTIRLGAGLAYYGLFTLIPLLSLCLFFSQDEVQSFISDHLSDTVGSDLDASAAHIATELDGWSAQASLGVIGLIGLLVAQKTAFKAVSATRRCVSTLAFSRRAIS
jgi:uncharacterized BrkB/YihY/UPF0761 family membrane protein